MVLVHSGDIPPVYAKRLTCQQKYPSGRGRIRQFRESEFADGTHNSARAQVISADGMHKSARAQVVSADGTGVSAKVQVVSADGARKSARAQVVSADEAHKSA
ncbi:hypothetical protein ACFO4N_15880 [Camelliibacillus cellulosilyticus]|uniref:BIG2 domain-containing protein n=1 Tax=Camelliibacillus cellulosilyticus TaxID=2174486 RepID=A0ABV9GQA7_9BACL